MSKKFFLSIPVLFSLLGSSYSLPLFETGELQLCMENYFMTDVISFDNVLDLDSANRQDSTTYLGMDYSFAFDLKFKDEGPRFYLKFERNGPYDYDAPLFIDGKLLVSGPSEIKAYRREDLLPQAEEFWLDLPVAGSPIRFRLGLFPYDVGKGFAQGTGSFENYGLSLAHPGEDFSWRFYYFRPDLVYKNPLGPRVKDEEQEGIGYEHNSANYFAFDALFCLGENKFLPFIGLLLDNTSPGKRANKFAAPVHKEVLGTLGFDYDLNIKDFSWGFEIARNFGKGKSEDAEFEDIEHKGYFLYTAASYNIGKFAPHCRFFYSSGNKVTTEMVDNGDEEFISGANKAFSVYSPLNTNLFDSLCPSPEALPLVFFGWGYGLNYGVGVNRPSTLADVCLLDNLIMPSIGLDYKLSDKFTVTLDYWYIKANEKGAGTFEGIAREFSRELGQEIDLSFCYDINKHVNIGLYAGYFFPGRYFKESRDAEDSLFTPFVRGDGSADGAFQIEFVTEVCF